MRLFALRCGHLSVDEGILDGGGLKGTTRRVPSMVFAIDHPEGILLWDTSMNPLVCTDAVGYWGPLAESISIPHYAEDETPVTRLASIGIGVEDVGFVVNSHLHNDHCGANRCFTEATFLYRRSEYGHAVTAITDRWSGFVGDDFLDDDLDYELFDYESRYDIFGDASLLLLSTAGHTPGHQSLLVSFPSGRRFVLTGDAMYTAGQLAEGRPGGLTIDEREASASAAMLAGLAATEGTTVLIPHEPSHWTDVETTALLHEED